MSILLRDSQAILHNRKCYGAFDLLRDLGGMIQITMLIIGYIIFPISE